MPSRERGGREAILSQALRREHLRSFQLSSHRLVTSACIHLRSDLCILSATPLVPAFCIRRCACTITDNNIHDNEVERPASLMTGLFLPVLDFSQPTSRLRSSRTTSSRGSVNFSSAPYSLLFVLTAPRCNPLRSPLAVLFDSRGYPIQRLPTSLPRSPECIHSPNEIFVHVAVICFTRHALAPSPLSFEPTLSVKLSPKAFDEVFFSRITLFFLSTTLVLRVGGARTRDIIWEFRSGTDIILWRVSSQK